MANWIIPVGVVCLLFLSFSTAGYSVSIQNYLDKPIVLVTGFEPFGEYDINPSQLIAQTLNGQELDDVVIYGLVLPVDFNASVKQITDAIDNLHPILVVSIGLEAKTYSIQVENVAKNLKHDPSDTQNDRRFSRLNLHGPFFRLSSLPTHVIVRELRQNGIPAQQSWSAGTYVCNALFYGEVSYIKTKNLPIDAGFLHVPLLTSQNPQGMDLQVMVDAIKITITTSLQEQR